MKSLIPLLRCPISGQMLDFAPEGLVRLQRTAQRTGTLRNRNGELPEPFEGGLVTRDGAWLFPIRSGIPVMLAGEAMGMEPGGRPGSPAA